MVRKLTLGKSPGITLLAEWNFKGRFRSKHHTQIFQLNVTFLKTRFRNGSNLFNFTLNSPNTNCTISQVNYSKTLVQLPGYRDRLRISFRCLKDDVVRIGTLLGASQMLQNYIFFIQAFLIWQSEISFSFSWLRRSFYSATIVWYYEQKLLKGLPKSLSFFLKILYDCFQSGLYWLCCREE